MTSNLALRSFFDSIEVFKLNKLWRHSLTNLHHLRATIREAAARRHVNRRRNLALNRGRWTATFKLRIRLWVRAY